MDDRVNAYVVAVENFGKTARAVSSELGALTVPAETSTPVDPSVPATTGPFLQLLVLSLFFFF